MDLFKTALNGNIQELQDILLTEESLNQTEKVYLSGLRLAMNGERENLIKLIASINDEDIAYKLLFLRSGILSFNIDKSAVLSLKEDLESSKLQPAWKGEAYNVLGLCFRWMGEYREAINCFKKSYRFFWNNEIKLKAVRVLLNVVTNESHLDNSKKYLTDYEFVYNKAMEVDDRITMGVCKLNMAREFRIMGGVILARKLIDESLEYLKVDRGVNHYYYAHLEKAYILIDSGDYNNAYISYLEAKESNLDEIKESLKILKRKLGEKNEVEAFKLDPAWGAYFTNRYNKQDLKMSKQESELIKALSKSPQTKYELIDKLYGNKIDFDSAVNRLKVLLSRFRKKQPNFILLIDGHYQLSEVAVLKYQELTA